MKYYSNHVLLSFICRTTLLLLGAQQMLIHESETQLSSSSQKNNNRGKKKKKNVRGEENRCGGGWPNGIGNSPSRCHARHRRLASRPRPSSSLQSLLFHLFLHQPFRFQKPHLSGHTHQNQKNYFLILFFQFLASFSTPKKHFI